MTIRFPARWAPACLALALVGCPTPAPTAPDAAMTPDAFALDGGADAGTDTGVDAGTDAGADAGPAQCVTIADCDDDGLFCNGSVLCIPGSPRADARGCVIEDPPCLTGQTCNEDMNVCETICSTNPDADHDGVDAVACGGQDCDDSTATRSPLNDEVCDSADVDEDCDATTFGARDYDGDGYVSAQCCNVAGTARNCGPDCDDTRPSVNAAVPEVCDGRDNDCNGTVDDGVTVAGYRDEDGDLYGTMFTPLMLCPGLGHFSVSALDCDDTTPGVHGGLVEVCDHIDNDCNGQTDDASAAVVWYRDADGDGYGNAASGVVLSCTPPTGGYVTNPYDCDDTRATVNPGVREACNGADDDCNGVADYAIAPGDYEDDDLDGYPDMRCPTTAPRDCNDWDPTVHPTAPELCDHLDNDCDGDADATTVPIRWHTDADHDGYGDARDPGIESCELQRGRVPNALDCNDADLRISPSARDGCYGRIDVDDDCDGTIDDGATEQGFWPDSDGDGYGAGTYVIACGAPPGFAAAPGDCSPGDPTRHPHADEQCDAQNGVDDDCDGLIDCDDVDCESSAVCAITYRLAVTGGDGQTVQASTTLPTPISIRVTDLAGAPVPARSVTIQPQGGSVALVPTQVTDATGVARFSLRASPSAGTDVVRVTSPNARATSFTIVVTPAAAGSVGSILNARFSRGGASGIPGAAINASIEAPSSMAAASDGTVFVTAACKLYEISPTGRITLAAGSDTCGEPSDGSDFESATFPFLTSVATDPTGTLVYVADSTRIWQLDRTSGAVTRYAGGGSLGGPGYGEGELARDAQISLTSLAVLSDGSVVFDDLVFQANQGRIRRVGTDGRIRTWIAPRPTLPDGLAIDFSNQVDLVELPDGSVALDAYDTTTGGEVIVVRDTAGNLQRVAGGGSAQADGPALSVFISRVGGLAADGTSILYSEEPAHVVRRIDPQGRVTTVAGTFNVPGADGDGGPATSAHLENPTDIAMLGTTSLAILDSHNHAVRVLELAPATGTPTMSIVGAATRSSVVTQIPAPLVVSVRDGAGVVGGVTVSITPMHPGVQVIGPSTTVTAADGTGTFYVRAAPEVTMQPFVIRGTDGLGRPLAGSPVTIVIDATAPAAGTITPFMNATGAESGSDPGPALGMHIGQANGVALDASGNVYFASNVRVYRIDPRGVITHFAGNGVSSTNGDGLDRLQASFSSPRVAGFDPTRNQLLVADVARLRTIDVASGVVARLLGGGSGFGEGLPGSLVDVSQVYSVGVDGDGDRYVHTTRGMLRVDGAGLVTTWLAPNGSLGAYSDRNSNEFAIGSGPAGDLLVASSWSGPGCSSCSGVLRVNTTTGTATLIAGGGTGFNPGSPATASRLGITRNLRVDAAGNVYLSQQDSLGTPWVSNRILRIRVDGVLEVAAGSGQSGRTGDFGPATSASLQIGESGPLHFWAVSSSGRLYIADDLDPTHAVLRTVW